MVRSSAWTAVYNKLPTQLLPPTSVSTHDDVPRALRDVMANRGCLTLYPAPIDAKAGRPKTSKNKQRDAAATFDRRKPLLETRCTKKKKYTSMVSSSSSSSTSSELRDELPNGKLLQMHIVTNEYRFKIFYTVPVGVIDISSASLSSSSIELELIDNEKSEREGVCDSDDYSDGEQNDDEKIEISVR